MKGKRLSLGHNYWLDSALTLHKTIKNAETGKTRDKVIGYYGRLENALKSYPDCILEEGIMDGSIKSVNHALLRLESINKELKQLAFDLRTAV